MSSLRRFGSFVLDLDRAELRRDGAPVDLQPKVLDLLSLLSAEPGRIFSKQELLDALWPKVRVTEASLHQAFRKARRALGDDPDAPAVLEAVAKRGWRWIAPLEPDPPAGSPGFVGREPELEAIARDLRPGRAIALHGPGGAGKTRLAREVALRWSGLSLVVALGADPDGAVRTVAHALGIGLETADPQVVLDRIGAALAARGGLVVLDELEGIPGLLAEPLAAWRAAAPEVAWLLTSRVTIPGADVLPILGLPPAPARALLRARAPTPLSDSEADAVLASLEGLPLPIELAAGRLRVLGPAGLAERLATSLRVLSSGPLWASIGESVDPLVPADRVLLVAGAVFPRPFDADELLELVDVDAAAALDSLERLMDASLVQRVDGRFALSGLVREYVLRDGAGDAIARWVRAAARAAERWLPSALAWDPAAFVALRSRLGDWLDALRRSTGPERDALAAAVGFACRYGGPWGVAWAALSGLEQPSPLAAVLAFEYSIRVGKPGERPTGDAPDDVAAYSHYLQARLHAGRGEPEQALAEAALAESLADRAGNDSLVAQALDATGTVYRLLGDVPRMRDCYERALRRPSGSLVLGTVSMNYAASLAQAGLGTEAIARLRLAVEALDEREFPHLEAVARANLAKALLQAGRAREAAPLLEASLAGARRVGDRRTVAAQAEDLALARSILGDGVGAEALLDEARANASPTGAASLGLRRVWAATARGDAAEAIARLETATALAGTEVQRAHAAIFAVGLARRLGDERLLARVLPGALAALAVDPDFGPWVEAWRVGGAVPGETWRVPADVWAVAGSQD